MRSGFFQLNLKDVIKGVIVAVITAFLTSLLSLLQAGTIEMTWAFWQPTVYASVIAGISYLLKNVFTNSQDHFGKAE